MEAQSASEASRTWRREMDEWQNALQRCVSEALAEVRELIEGIESQIQQESVVGATRTSAVVPPAVGTVTKTQQGGPASSPAGWERVPASMVDVDRPLTVPPTERAAGSSTSDHRLAELARRLEEKLGRSRSADARPRES